MDKKKISIKQVLLFSPHSSTYHHLLCSPHSPSDQGCRPLFYRIIYRNLGMEIEANASDSTLQTAFLLF